MDSSIYRGYGTMNKEREIRSLTWKYFWEQKIQEVQKFTFILLLILLGITAMVYIPYLIGHSIGDNKSKLCGDQNIGTLVIVECDTLEQWGEGFLYLLITSMVIFMIYFWVTSNWEKANKKAKIDINKNKRAYKYKGR